MLAGAEPTLFASLVEHPSARPVDVALDGLALRPVALAVCAVGRGLGFGNGEPVRREPNHLHDTVAAAEDDGEEREVVTCGCP